MFLAAFWVLVAGGVGNGYLASSELFDATSASWTTTGVMNVDRMDHAATFTSQSRNLTAGDVIRCVNSKY